MELRRLTILLVPCAAFVMMTGCSDPDSQSGWAIAENDDAGADAVSSDADADTGGEGRRDSDVASPCVQVSPEEELRFGQVYIGRVERRTVTVENCSDSAPLVLESATLTGDSAFSLEYSGPGGDGPSPLAQLAPGERYTFDVVARLVATDRYSGELIIESDDPERPQLRLPVFAAGTYCEGPHALAEAAVEGDSILREELETVPRTTVVLDGSRSFDADASPDDSLRYEWTILSRPPGSTSRFTPNHLAEQPRFFLDTAGSYAFELKVYDEQGSVSCGEPAIVRVDAVPDRDVFIELWWDTPNDPDQTDSHGADLDLHYLHANGRWDDPPWDIYWRNPTADWGTRGSAEDDPRLELDDSDGFGPEQIRHSGLENLDYHIGVYYLSDRGFGESLARVRVWVRGQIEFDVDQELGRTDDFWDVASIGWPRATVTRTGRVHSGFPGTP